MAENIRAPRAPCHEHGANHEPGYIEQGSAAEPPDSKVTALCDAAQNEITASQPWVVMVWRNTLLLGRGCSFWLNQTKIPNADAQSQPSFDSGSHQLRN